MGKIAIVTDSSANLPKELVEKYDIHVVPIILNWEGQTLRDGVDITPRELYLRLREDRNLPTTSTPSVGDFVRVYATLSKEAEAIVSLHLSSELSAVFNTARVAKDTIEAVPIYIIDTRTATMAHGFVTLEAARMASAGSSLDGVLHRIEEMIPKVNFIAVLDTLEYLHRGGRVPAIASFAGSLLQIKPILSMKDGTVGVLEKPRTKAKAIRRMLEIMAERSEGPLHVAVFHADALEEAKRLRDQIKEDFDCAELFITEFTPVMGAHTGPGLVGFAFYSDKN